MPDLDFKVTTVTPELAEYWLTKNTHNRNIRIGHVRGLSADMKSGEWAWNGESIKFAQDGTLLDGQHRLAAIVDSRVAVKMLVVENVSNASQHTMDTGAKRTPGDTLRLRGEKHGNVLAAGIRASIIWDMGGRSFTGKGGAATTTTSQILRYLESHPEMREYAYIHGNLRTNGVKIPASVGMLAIRLFHEIDHDDAVCFIEKLASGEGIYKGEPIYELRKILTSNEGAKITRTPSYLLAVTIKAWNKFRAGENVSLLVYRPGGSKPEKFPIPM